MRLMIETPSIIDVTTANIEGFLAELEQYREIYHDLFRRREQREQYDVYLQGLLLDIPNKSVETMILHMYGDDPNAIRRSQHFVSAGSWQDEAILQRHWQEVNYDLGTPDGVIIFDDSGFPKQGQESVRSKSVV